MRGSLANLPRMSMDALNTREDADRALRIWLLSAATREGGATYYRIAGRFQANGQTWEVLRRYSDFLALRTKLIKFLESADDEGDACPGCVNYLHSIKRFEFPKKHIFSSRNAAVVNYRVKALRSFMNLLASWAFSTSPKCPLCGGHAFELVRNFVVDGAEPVTGSDMDAIRGSMSVDAFTSNAERPSGFAGRPSAFARPSLDRRHSWIPASGSTTLRAVQEQEQGQAQQQNQGQEQRQVPRQQQAGWNPSKSVNHTASRPPQHQMPDAYDTFNDYLPARPSQRAKGSNTDAGQSTSKFGIQRKDSGQSQTTQHQPVPLANAHTAGGFLLYDDDRASFGRQSIDAAAAPRRSTVVAANATPPSGANGGLKSAMRKQKSEPRNVVQHAAETTAEEHDNDSFVSFSSTVAANSIASAHGNARSNGRSVTSQQHSNMLSSPNAQPQNASAFDSFVSDMSLVSFSVEPALPPSEYAAASQHSDVFKQRGDDSEDDDELLDDDIDITGLAFGSSSPAAPRLVAKSSGENLWQPWELDRNG